jgi:hypothetical protein
MKKLILGLAFLLAGAVNAFGQSTTVSGTVTDLGAQAWAGGTFQFTFVPNPQFPVGPYTWTGGALNTTIAGFLDGTGSYSQSVPDNATISPIGSKWILQVTPNATSPSFSASATTITGATQTLNVTPPAIAINLTVPPGSTTRAYADAEIVGAIIGSQYYNVTIPAVRVCQAVTGQACTTWASVGAGGGGPPTGPAGGDLFGTFPNPGVGQVNGAAVPTSAPVLGSNALKQLISASAHGVSTPLACAAASASGTAYTCTTSPTFVPADGDSILFEADVANTGAATLNVNASSAAPIKKQGGGAALVANDILAGQDTVLIFDGTNWQMQGQTGNAPSVPCVTTALSLQYNNAGVFGCTTYTFNLGSNLISATGSTPGFSVNSTATSPFGGAANLVGFSAAESSGNVFSSRTTATSPTNKFAIGAFPTGIIIGNSGTGRCDFVSGGVGTADCAVGLFASALDTPADTVNGQDLIGVEATVGLNKTIGHTVNNAVGFRVTSPSNNAGVCCPAPEHAANIWGLEILDLGALATSNTEMAGVKIHSNTAPSAGTKFSIKADVGSGQASFGDGTVFPGSTSGSCTQSVTATATIFSNTCPFSAVSVSTAGDGVHPGNISLVGNTTALAPSANTFNIMGPNLAAFTAYTLQFPSAAPAAHSLIATGAPVSSVSPATYVVVPDCTDSAGNHLNYTQSTDLFSCGTSSSSTGVTSVDGSAGNGVQTVQGGAIAAITGTGTVQASRTQDTQTGVASYAHINGDRGKLLVRSNSGAAMTDTLSQAAAGAAAAFGPGWFEEILNTDNSANLTITATTSTFSSTGTSTLVVPPQGWCVLSSDGTNYKNRCSGGLSAVTSTTLATVTNPTINTDTQLTELSLPAGYLNTLGQGYLIRAGGLYNNTVATSPAITITAKLCTVSGCGSGTVVSLGAIASGASSATATTNASWGYDLYVITKTTGATGNVLAKGDPGLTIGLSNVITAADSVYMDPNTATSGNIDLTAALFLDFTVAQSVAGASNVYKQLSAMIAPQSNPTQANGGGGGASQMTFGCSAACILTTTEYFNCTASAATSATETTRECFVPYNGTLSGMYVNLDTAANAGVTLTFTARRNEGATSITCALTAAQSCNDVAHTQAYVKGDKIALQSVNTNTAAGTNRVSATLVFTGVSFP